MKTIFSFFATVLFCSNGFTQTSSSEVTCRAQAKEVAMQTYSSCITEARATQVDEIRKNYQKELADLKAKYDIELKKLGAGNKKANKEAKASTAMIKEKKAPKAVKGVAKQLPTKSISNEDAAPVQVVAEGNKVVAIGTEEAPEIENEASSVNDPVEVVEMPVE